MRCFVVSLLRVLGAPYHGMVSEGLLSIHHRLQIHCIVNVNICIKGPDDYTIVFYRSLKERQKKIGISELFLGTGIHIFLQNAFLSIDKTVFSNHRLHFRYRTPQIHFSHPI